MKPAKMPKSLVVMGSGAIGIEFASFYRTMGAEVTVVELLPTIMPVEDAEIAAFEEAFEKQGIKILTEAKVAKVDKKGGIRSPPTSRPRPARSRRSPPMR
jgi:dihydrolipoamide dehydrogenase